MDQNHDVNLKSIFSGPAYLSHIFYIIKNKDKIWDNESRENSSPDILYSWTYDFIKILGFGLDYNQETKKITLTEEGEKLYNIIKNIDNSLLYIYGEVNESNIEEYEKKLIENINNLNVKKIKDILYISLINTKGYNIIKNLLYEKGDISKGNLYQEIAEQLGVAKGTLGNRVPSILQLAKFLGLFSLKNGKYSINKNNSNIIKESEQEYNQKTYLSSNPKNMENLTSQEALLLLSLLTKPFSILYGVSGTGKSRVVKELWKKIYGNDYIKYFYKEAVPPNWFDETEILGRYNEIEKYKEGSFTKILEKAIKDTENNYVYLLDEMNLSHIEQYFAQYLSAVEDLDNGNAWIKIGEYSEYIVSSKNGVDFEKYNKNIEKEYVLKYFLDKENYENLSYKNIKKIINAINKENFSGNFNGKKIKGISIKGEITSFTSNRKTYNFIMQYLIDNHFDNLEKTEKYKNVFSRNKEDITYGDYAIEEYNGFFYANNFSTNETIRHLFNIINEYSEITDKEEILLLTDDVELLEQEGFINNLDKLELIGKSLKIPKNLFVVGTINLDETTKSISPKVVDRANLIEFNDIGDFLGIEDEESRYKLDFLDKLNIDSNFSNFLEIRSKISQLQGGKEILKDIDLENTTIETIAKLYRFLKVFKLHYSYRTIKEIIIFIQIGKALIKNGKEKNIENKLLDIAIMQKVLPKLNGVIDYNFKLYKNNTDGFNYLWYESDDESLLKKEVIKMIQKGFKNDKDDFINTTIKLERMQQFFDTYQNINYFLS